MVLSNKVEEDELNNQVKNDLKAFVNEENKSIDFTKNMSFKVLKSDKGLENAKTVSFKDDELEESEKVDENFKMRKPSALLKSTSIRRYEHPNLLNEDA